MLNYKTFDPPVIERDATAVNHVWIYDRSGSMYRLLSQVAADLKEQVSRIKDGDTLTLAWFSGEGSYNIVLKGFQVFESNHDQIFKIIDANKTTLGTTCFSEVLMEVSNIADDLAPISEDFSLVFFTDGYPVVRSLERETENIFRAIEKFSGRIAAAIFVGYGDYYNRDLMLEMANIAGGELVHSSNLSVFFDAMEDFVSSQSGYPRFTLELDYEPYEAFSITDGSIAPCRIEDNRVFVPGTATRILVSSNNGPGDLTETDQYAAAYMAIQNNNVDEALNIMGELGDVYFIDDLTNAFTVAEYGEVAAEIKKATFSKGLRFQHGKDTNYLPDPNAFCALDAIDLLAQDQDAYFHTWHPSFVYKRIGRKTETDGDYPKFEADEKVAFPINSLSWNKSRLNLSLRGRIDGTIKLGSGVKKHGFANPFRTYVWRNYTIIKDGVLNVQVLPVSCSEATFKKLQENMLIDQYADYSPNTIYDVNLSEVPVMNRAMTNVSALDMAALCAEELSYMADAKVAKTLLAELETEDKKISEILTPEQDEFLRAHGITKDGFNPPSKQAEATDYYMAKTFEVKAAGFSSLPKLSDVIERNKNGSKQTNAGQMMLNSLHQITMVIDNESDANKIKMLKHFLDITNSNLAVVRSKIARMKFGVILGKKWFPEFDTRDNPQISHNGIIFKFVLGEQKVTI